MTIPITPRIKLFPLVGSTVTALVLTLAVVFQAISCELQKRWEIEAPSCACCPGEAKEELFCFISRMLEMPKRLEVMKQYRLLSEKAQNHSNRNEFDQAQSCARSMILLLDSNDMDRGGPMKQALLLLWNMGAKEDEVTASYERWYGKSKLRYGSDNPAVVDSLRALALNYSHYARREKELLLYRKWVEISEKHYGPVSKPTEISLINLAGLYHLMHWHDEAIPALQRTIQVIEEVDGRVSPAFALCERELGLEYLAVGRLEEAENCFKESLDTRVIMEGVQVQREPYIVNDFGYLRLAQGNIDEAEELFLRALKTVKKKNRRWYQQRIPHRSVAGLGYCYERRGNLEKAADCIGKAIQLHQFESDPDLWLLEQYNRDKERMSESVRSFTVKL